MYHMDTCVLRMQLASREIDHATINLSLSLSVPLSVIASWKKIKSLGATNQMLVKALRTSTKLVSTHLIFGMVAAAAADQIYR